MENFEELNSENTTFQQGSISGNGGEEPILKETDRKKLDGIVQKMIQNKESDENIKFVVNDFKKKYGTSQPKGVQAGTNQNGASKSVSANGVSLSESLGGLKSKPKTIMQKMQENEMSKPKIGETIIPKSKFDKKVEEESVRQDEIWKSKAPIAQKIKQSLSKAPTKVPEKENIITQWEYDSKNSINKDPINPYYKEINNDDITKANEYFDNIISSGIDNTDFVKYLKNKTSFYDGGDINVNHASEEEFNKDSILKGYIQHRENVLSRKYQYAKTDEEKNKIALEAENTYKYFENYRKTNLPNIVAVENQKKQRDKEIYQNLKTGNNRLSTFGEGLGNVVDNFYYGLKKPVQDVIAAGADLVGSKLGDKIRNNQNYISWYRDNGVGSHVLVKGKQVEYNGNNYTVTPEGAIYDNDTETMINSFSDEKQISKILDLSKNSKKESKFFNQKAATNHLSGAASFAVMMALTDGVGSSALEGVGMTANAASKTASMVTMSTTMGASAYNDTVNQLKQAGISDSEAKTQATKAGVAGAVVGAFAGKILELPMSSGFIKNNIAKNISKDFMESYIAGGEKGVNEYLKNGLLNTLKNSVKGGANFAGFTAIQSTVNAIMNGEINDDLGKKILDDKITKDKIVEDVVSSFISGGILGMMGGNPKLSEYQKLSFLSHPDNYDSFIKTNQEKVNKGIITPEEFQKSKDIVDKFKKYSNKIPTDISAEKVIDLLDVLEERNNLETEKKNSDKAFHEGINQKLEKVDEKIKKIINGENDKNTSSTETKSEEDSERPKSETGDRETEDKETLGTGKSTQDFFGTVVKGGDERYTPSKSYEYEQEFTPEQNKFRENYDSKKGNFDEHIATSIPTFRETQVKKGNAIVKTLEGEKNPVVYDLGGSEGSWIKTITEESGGKIKTINLDPSPDMQEAFNKNKPENSEMSLEAFHQGWDDVPTHKPKEKADVVHESMMFQFIDNNGKRDHYIDEVKNNYLKEDGLFVTEEKFKMDNQKEYDENENLKKPHKDKYFTKEQQDLKSDEVLVGMKENQANFNKYLDELKSKFKYVETYWKSGNFRGIVASDSESKINKFMENLGETSNKKYTWERPYEKSEVSEIKNAKQFVDAQKESISKRKSDSKQVDILSEKDAQKILDEGGKLFMTNDGKSGAYVKADGYMGGLFKDPTAGRSEAAKVLQEVRIEHGGKFFDAFGTHLEDIYVKNGFKPVVRMDFNEEFAPKGWKDTNLKDKPDNVFFVYDPKSDPKVGEGIRLNDYEKAYEIAKNYESKQTIDKTEKTGGNKEGKDTSNDEISKGKSGEETGGNVTVSFDDSDSKSSGGSKVYNFASYDVTPLRESFSELKKAYKDGVRDTQSLKREFINKVKQSIKGLGNYITERDAKSILNQVGNVTEKNIEEVSKIIDNISDRLEERKMKSEFAQVKGKLKKNSKSGSKLQPTNIKETAKQALTINEKYLSPEQQIEFKNIIDEINDSFSSVTSDKYKMMDVEKVMEKIDKLKEISDNNQLKELADMLGVDSSIVPKDELLKLWKSENADEFAKNLSEAKKKEVRDKLQKQTEYSKIGLKNVDFGSLDNIQKKFLRNLLKSDLSKLDLEGLKQFIKFSDNIIVNGDFSNVGKLSAKIESIKNIESLMNTIRRDNIKVEKVSTDKKGITGIAKSIFDAMTDISLTLNQIMGSAKNGSMAYNYLNFFDLSNANTRANKRGEKFLDNYNNLIKSLKKNTFDDITHGESVIKRSIFSTLLQADYSSPESMKRFKDGYIQHSIDMLKKYTNDSQSSSIAEICERTLKDLKDINTKEELIDYLKNNESKNYKIIRFVSGKEGFLGLTKEFSDNSYYNHGVIFEPKKEEDYYVPLTSSNVIKPKLLKGNIEDAKKSGDLEGIVAPNSKSGSIFSRNNNVRLKEGETINFDFDSFISQKYKEQLYDIEATNEILKTKNILTNPEFLDKFGSSANLLNQKAFNKIVLDSGRNIYKHSDIERSILKAERFAGKLASVQALGGFLQYPKQYASVAIGASIRLAENAPLLFKYMMMDKAGTELLKMSSIAMRGESEGGTKRLSDNIKKDVLTTNKYNNIIKDISSMTGMKIEKAREFFMLSLRKGDVNIANTTFLAYYHDFLLRKGVKNSEIDINKEHEKIKEGDELRKEALAYAQHMVNTTQLSSDLSEGSDLLTNQSVAFKLLSRVVIPFSSFSNHSMVRLAKASGGVLTGENKVENFKEATASVSEIIAFQSIKALVIAPMLMAASKAIFQDDDETQKKTTDWAFQMNKVISGSLQDFSPLPDSFDTDFINYIMYLKNKDNYKVDSFEDFAGKVKKDKSEEKPWTMYKYGDEDGWDFLKGGVKDAGLYQVFIDQNKKTLESFDALMDNEITQKNKYGQTEQYHFDEKYRNFLIMNAISNTMSSVGVFDADVKRFIESEYRDVKKDSKVHSSGGGSSSSGFGGFGSGFSKGFGGFGK